MGRWRESRESAERPERPKGARLPRAKREYPERSEDPSSDRREREYPERSEHTSAAGKDPSSAPKGARESLSRRAERECQRRRQGFLERAEGRASIPVSSSAAGNETRCRPKTAENQFVERSENHCPGPSYDGREPVPRRRRPESSEVIVRWPDTRASSCEPSITVRQAKHK